jgi:hypothetical protein
MMNSLTEDELPGAHYPREMLLGMMTDADLTYRLPGRNPTLGELCLEIGRLQQVYTESFRTLTLDWNYRGSTPEDATRIAGLQAWFETLDAAMQDVLSQMSQQDIQQTQVNRGNGFAPSIFVQFQIYREALYIYWGKASVYLRALEKDLTPEWQSWIG